MSFPWRKVVQLLSRFSNTGDDPEEIPHILTRILFNGQRANIMEGRKLSMEPSRAIESP